MSGEKKRISKAGIDFTAFNQITSYGKGSLYHGDASISSQCPFRFVGDHGMAVIYFNQYMYLKNIYGT